VSVIFSRNKLKHHRNRAAFSDKEYDFLFDYSAETIFSKLEDLNYLPTKILEIGARRGSLTELLYENYKNSTIITTDIAEQAIRSNPSNIKIVLDEEQLCFQENSFDLILSSLNIHWINDLPRFLLEVKSALTPNGTFIASFIGGNSLKDFRTKLIKAEMMAASPHFPHISPMIEHETITGLLQNIGFKNIVTEKETVAVEYQNIFSLMSDLKYMGESSCFHHSTNYALNRATLKYLETIYTEPFEELFEIISFTVCK
jgi:ubiquinone/menaquinone biosynthesis C-methylase UbiE